MVLFLTLRLKFLWNSLKFKSESFIVRGTIICGILFCFLAGAHIIFYKLFSYLIRFPDIGSLLIENILFMFFFSVFFMLFFSNGILAYSALYNSRETMFLLTTPTSYTNIVGFKLNQIIGLSSWAMLFLIIPFLGAYVRTYSLTLSFFVSSFIITIPIFFISCFLGMIIIFLVLRFIPLKALKWLLVIAIVGVFFLWKNRTSPMQSTMDLYIVSRIFRHTRFSQNIWFPSAWLVKSIFALRNQDYSQSLFFFSFSTLTALLLGRLTFFVADKVYAKTFSRVKSYSVPTQHKGFFSRLFKKKNRFFVFVLKDALTLLRDPAYWFQGVVFFGMIFLYVINLKNLPYRMETLFWRNLVAFLNLGAVSLTMAMLNLRFTFPLFSREGRRYWIWGLSPLGREHILKEKFIVSFIPSLCVTQLLIIISNSVLQLPWIMFWIFSGLVFFMCIVICSLTVSLGVLYPIFGQDDAQIISSSFGGILLLVVDILYIGIVVSLLGTVFHRYFTSRINYGGFINLLLLVSFVVIGGSTVLTWGFLRKANRRLKVMDF